ncbi:DsrE family protein [Vagococcus jeotgali]|uniref:DsrE family protein n=1 Tax=Vagococcus jeotgali TaxID=3109030 RepID=UPI002DD9555B|nr:sulfur reduction protein DsrE [Vagococcus sp. B2T-5]
MKVVFHIHDLNKWQTVLTNVSNLLKKGEGKVKKVEVVANGAAVQGYKMDHHMDKIVVLSTDFGVHFNSCQFAMAHQHMTQDELPKLIQAVPSGVLRLAELQHEGYAYIRV